MSTKITERKTEQVAEKELVIIDERAFLNSVRMEGDKKKELRLDRDSFIALATGRRGGGKSSAINMLIVWAVIIWNFRLVSNLPIAFMIRRYRPDGKTYLQKVESETLDFEKLMLHDEAYKQVIIFIDESADIISHMASQTWKNRLTNAFVRQLRKNRNTLFLASQDFELIDKSMRWQVDIEIKCMDATRVIDNPKLLPGSVIWTYWYDRSGVWTNVSAETLLSMGENPCAMQAEMHPGILWGDDTHKPVFDTWYHIDILDSLRRVDMKLDTIKIGSHNTAVVDRYPVSIDALQKALNVIEILGSEKPESPRIYFSDFYRNSPMSLNDKNNLGRILTEFGVERTGSRTKRYYDFSAFNAVGFKQFVTERQA